MIFWTKLTVAIYLVTAAIGTVVLATEASRLSSRTNVRALILGDSHTYGSFGHHLTQLLAVKKGWEVVAVAVCPATAKTFLAARPEASCGLRVRYAAPDAPEVRKLVSKVRGHTRDLPTLLQETRPDKVLISLGTNMGAQSAATIRATSQELVGFIKAQRPGVDIIWIGPPAYKGAKRITKALATIADIPYVHYIASDEFNRARPLPSKNPHFGPQKAQQWAQFVFARLAPKAPLTTSPDPAPVAQSHPQTQTAVADSLPASPPPKDLNSPALASVGNVLTDRSAKPVAAAKADMAAPPAEPTATPYPTRQEPPESESRLPRQALVPPTATSLALLSPQSRPQLLATKKDAASARVDSNEVGCSQRKVAGITIPAIRFIAADVSENSADLTLQIAKAAPRCQQGLKQ